VVPASAKTGASALAERTSFRENFSEGDCFHDWGAFDCQLGLKSPTAAAGYM
jgi:hypothetical protein